MKEPIVVSVIMPVFNAEKYLSTAIDSILNQTFKSFEFLIFNDGSNDNTHSIIQKYQDKRIKYIKNETNLGIVNALNHCFNISVGKYLIRMDSDDIADKKRIEIQVDYMEKNRDVGVSGSFLKIIDSFEIVKKPLTDEQIRWWFFKGCPFAHPTVIIRTEVIKRYNLNYREEYRVAEDYDLWWRVAKITKLSNISDKLLSYRVHLEQESTANFLKQREKLLKSKIAFFNYLKINSSPENIQFTEKLFSDSLPYTPENLIKVYEFFKKLKSKESNFFFGTYEIDKTRHFFFKKHLINLEFYNINLIFFPRVWISNNWKYNFVFLGKCIINWKTRVIK
jgi:glycosyltransferase involved in cell wall biosynthesis